MSLTPESGDLSEEERRIFEEIEANINRTSAKDPHWNFWKRVYYHRRGIALGAAVLVAAGGIITDRSTQPDLPRDPMGEAKLRAYKDALVLGALGVCDAELRAEASLEAYRASRGKGSTSGVTVSVLQNAASVARIYGVSCEPSGQTDPASYTVTSSAGSEVLLYSDSLVSLSTANVCSFVADPLMPPPAHRAEAEHYMQAVSDITQRLKSETGQSC